MIIVGAKGFAKEILEVILQSDPNPDLFFFDNVNKLENDFLFERYRILKSFREVKEVKEFGSFEFCLGIGNPKIRRKLYQEFSSIKGILTSVISPKAIIGQMGNRIGKGVSIMSGTVLTSSTTINEGALINLNCTIGHDTVIGSFCELSPGVHVSGDCKIGNEVTLGTGCVILPKVRIGDGAIVGAGAVVTKNVDPNSLVVGIPARRSGEKM